MRTLLFVGAFLGLSLFTLEAQVYNFDTTADFDSTAGTPPTSEVTDTADGICFLENDTGDKPEAFADFTPFLDTFRFSFDFIFDNAGLTPISDPEIRMRFGNNGTNATSDAKTGWGMRFRHSNAGDNQLRAGRWNGSWGSTTSSLGSYQNIADNTPINIEVVGNNSYVDVVDCASGNTIPANTYDLYVDGVFIANYALAEDQGTDFDRDAGFGNLTITTSGNSDAGVNACFDNMVLSVGADSMVACIPTVGQWGLVLFALALSSMGLIAIRERKEEAIFA